jgi:dTDP-4-amino-4,6-dideoxygalactose transaminase
LPFLDLKAQFATIREELFEAVARTLESQQFILGAEVAAFESEIVGITGCSHAIACASGTDALILALRALDIGPGDEVITTPFTFVASAGSIENVGARPVFVDIDPHTFNIDPKKLDQAITPNTAAILPVHLFGLCAEMDKVNEIAAGQGLRVIEDAAQAIGAQDRHRAAGGLGWMGCFSFFPSKNLGGAGDGGLVTTNDEDCAERLKLLHVHGARERYEYEIVGMNSRLDALQAAILRVKLRHLNDWTNARRRNADRYWQLFKEFGLMEKLVLPREPEGKTHVYNQFTIRVANRDALRDKLRGKGVPSEIYYPIPLHLQRAFKHLAYQLGDFPESERASAEVLSLPIYPELTEEQQRTVVTAIGESLA